MPTETKLPAEIRKVPTLEELALASEYSDPRLANVTADYLRYLREEGSSVREFLESNHRLIFSQYSWEDAMEISRFKIFAAALTQSNVREDKFGRLQTSRRTEKGPDGKPLPADIHSERIMRMLIEMESSIEPDPVIPQAAKGHDLVEDVSYPYPNGGLLYGAELLQLIRKEFRYGDIIANTIAAVSKEVPIPQEKQQVLLASEFYKWLAKSVGGSSRKLNPDCLKTTASLFNLQSFPFDQYPFDPLQAVIQTNRNNKIKAADAFDNLGSPGTSDASLIRARVLALKAGLMGNYRLRNGILRRIREHHGDVPDFLHPANRLRELSIFDEERCLEMEETIRNVIREHIGIEVDVCTGDWIGHTDHKGKKGVENYAPVEQSVILCNPSDFDKLTDNIETLLDDPRFQEIVAGTDEALFADQVSGIIKSMVQIFDRQRELFSIKGKASNHPFHYLNIMDNQRFLWNYRGVGPLPPEGKFSIPYSNQAIMRQAITNEMLLYLDPRHLALANRRNGSSMIVWEDGLFTLTSGQNLAEECSRIGIDLSDRTPTDLIAFSRGTRSRRLTKLPPLCYLKKN